MDKGRLEAFSDGVIAILITIMVLELRIPEGANWGALTPLIPVLLAYLASFVFLGIYWNNHHHLLRATERINGNVMWANLHLLFWLSLTPFVTGWIGENHTAAVPTAVYGVVLLCSALSWWILQRQIIATQGPHSRLKTMLGRDLKGNISPLIYIAGIGLSFVNHAVAQALYISVALMWLVPDRRIERHLST